LFTPPPDPLPELLLLVEKKTYVNNEHCRYVTSDAHSVTPPTVVAGAIAIMVVPDWTTLGPGCRSPKGSARSANSAINAVFDGCIVRPDIERLRDAHKASSGFANYSDVVEFRVDSGRSTRFFVVGRRAPREPWSVLDQGSGP